MTVRRIAASVAGLLMGGLLSAAPASGISGTVASGWHGPIVAVNANQSNNWSGYNQGTLEQPDHKMFTQISGRWIVPTASQHKSGEAEYSSTWIGIGGGCVDANCQVTDSTLIQTGTEQDVDHSGSPAYSAWYELIPEPSTPIPSLTIHAGDRMAASITNIGSEQWEIVIKDRSTHKSFTIDTPYSSSQDTGEWITETPVVIDNNGNVTIGPLPNLSRVHFDRAIVDTKPAGLKASEQIQLVDTNSQPLATPSGVDPDADGFNDCTYTGTCPAPRRS